MSYDIDLVDPVTKKCLELDDKHHVRGGTYELGGTKSLHLNITYNYYKQFKAAFQKQFGVDNKGIRELYGLSGAKSIPVLESAIAELGDDIDEDYWKDTEGNAKRALYGLLAFAQLRPDGVWSGD